MADGLWIGCPKLAGGRMAGNSNMQEFFGSTLYKQFFTLRTSHMKAHGEEAATEYYGNARVERDGANVSIDFGTGGRRTIHSICVCSVWS